jgi:GST-like protein
MIELYYWPTPNGRKITIFLEEANLDYRIVPVDIGRGDQFKPEFLNISPNNRMPAIVDLDGPEGRPFSLFESGAILIYLADKTGKFLSHSPRERHETIQWLMFQMSGIGPMFGQRWHFRHETLEKIPYAIARYTNESRRLLNVLDRQLAVKQFLAGDYSIADMATVPWIAGAERNPALLANYPNLKRWLDQMHARPGVQRGLAVMREVERPTLDDESRSALFGEKQYQPR